MSRPSNTRPTSCSRSRRSSMPASMWARWLRSPTARCIGTDAHLARIEVAGASRYRGLTMILTTTTSVDGRPIRTYLGLVTGEAILGANLFRDLFAGIRDIVGGRSAAYEKELAKARQVALDE